jgi:hypothetical protein
MFLVDSMFTLDMLQKNKVKVWFSDTGTLFEDTGDITTKGIVLSLPSTTDPTKIEEFLLQTYATDKNSRSPRFTLSENIRLKKQPVIESFLDIHYVKSHAIAQTHLFIKGVVENEKEYRLSYEFV